MFYALRFMSTRTQSNFETLPIELVHRIFDEIPADTIALSIRCVCKWLYSIVNAYNRYEVDFRYVSKSDLPLMARIIDPKNIISLTLSNELLNEVNTQNQIPSFLSNFHIDQFIRLRSLTLFNVENDDLNEFQKHIVKFPLTTFSMSSPYYGSTETAELLSSIISNNDLRKFEFKGGDMIVSKIQWPISCRLENVTISDWCNWKIVYLILERLPYIRTLAIRLLVVEEPTVIRSDIIQSSHLTSLSLNSHSTITMDFVKSFLSLLPMLTHLRLIIESSLTDLLLFDGFQWANFIQTKLSLLNKFEFSFTHRAPDHSDSSSVELLIASFRTPFWLEVKHWFVTCDLEYKHYKQFHLYSIPIFQDDFDYPVLRRDILYSTLNNIDNNLTIIVNTHRLFVDLIRMRFKSIRQNVSIILYFQTDYFFSNKSFF
ncbi:unnamed protein product [Rotaria sp. Silwood1]|nr:unnamed protein product [Rotaria sp. Silwood1]